LQDVSDAWRHGGTVGSDASLQHTPARVATSLAFLL